MNSTDDWFPLVPTGSRNQSEGEDVATGLTGSQPGIHPPEGDGTSRNQSPPTGRWWQPPTPQLAPRLWPAWHALIHQLADGNFHNRTSNTQTMLDHSDITPKTAANLIANAAKYGLIQRRYYRKTYQDRLTPLGINYAAELPMNATDQGGTR